MGEEVLQCTLSGKYKLKGDATVHTLEWPKSGTRTPPNDDKDVEWSDRNSLHC